MSSTTPYGSSVAAARRDRRASREQTIVAATRTLFDQRGIQDCGVSLLRRPALELRVTPSDAAWFRVSRAVGTCVGAVRRVLVATPGAVTAVVLDSEQVKDACILAALAVVGVRNEVAS